MAQTMTYELGTDGVTFATTASETLGDPTTFSGLSNGTAYYARVRVDDGTTNLRSRYGYTFKGTPSASGGDPSAPSASPRSYGEDAVEFQISADSGATWTTVSKAAGTKSHTFTGLTNGQEYRLRVRTKLNGTPSPWASIAVGSPASAAALLGAFHFEHGENSALYPIFWR